MNNVALLRSIITEAAQSVVGTSLTFVEQERVFAQTMTRLVEQHGGTDTRVYIPKTDPMSRAMRAREIRALAQGGVSVGSLATRYGLSVRQVRRFVGRTSSG
jgi:Mor family transcriptional regulator